jgi:hypothetical protein
VGQRPQLTVALCGVNWPAAHRRQPPAPSGLGRRGSAGTPVESSKRNFPAGHSAQRAAPAAEKCPRKQGWHQVALWLSANLPSGHAEHSAASPPDGMPPAPSSSAR